MMGVSEDVSWFVTSSTLITFSTSASGLSSMSVGTTTSGCFFLSTSSSDSEEDELDSDVVCLTSFSTGNGIACSFSSSESELDEELLLSLLNMPVIFSVTGLSEGVGCFGISSTTTISLSSELEEDEIDSYFR